jgi:hypothetical protein
MQSQIFREKHEWNASKSIISVINQDRRASKLCYSDIKELSNSGKTQ